MTELGKDKEFAKKIQEVNAQEQVNSSKVYIVSEFSAMTRRFSSECAMSRNVFFCYGKSLMSVELATGTSTFITLVLCGQLGFEFRTEPEGQADTIIITNLRTCV